MKLNNTHTYIYINHIQYLYADNLKKMATLRSSHAEFNVMEMCITRNYAF
jgi:hypothetical protein